MSVLAAAMVLVPMTTGSYGSTNQTASQARNPASPKCLIRSINVNARTGRVKAVGGCRIRGYRTHTRWTYSYTVHDHQGNRCGQRSTTGSRRFFSIRPLGVYRVTLRFTLRAHLRSGQLRGRTVSRSKTINLGGRMAQCGKLGKAPLPPATDLCAWPPPPAMARYGSCGFPQEGTLCAWSSRPAFTNGWASPGSIACKAGSCWLEQKGAFPWLGYDAPWVELRCGNPADPPSSQAHLGTLGVGLTNPQGQTCGPVSTPIFNILAFRVPPAWGGTLKVIWTLQSRGTQEFLTAQFRLPGTEDGCPQLLAEGKPTLMN
jgi:hypothetical protein